MKKLRNFSRLNKFYITTLVAGYIILITLVIHFWPPLQNVVLYLFWIPGGLIGYYLMKRVLDKKADQYKLSTEDRIPLYCYCAIFSWFGPFSLLIAWILNSPDFPDKI